MSSYTSDAEEVPIEVGEDMNNPYTLENMQKAADELKLSRQLQITHRYIRFLPQTTEEIVTLVDKKDIRVFDYPLDKKLSGNTCGFHDKSLPDDQVTWLYSSIPINQSYPSNIRHEILADLYIPTDEEYALEATALELAGYKELAREMRENATGKTDGAMATTAYRPSGKLKVWNNSINIEEPLRNVKLTLTTFFKWNDVWTDQNGYFTATKNFLVPVDVWLTFGNNHLETRTLSGSVFPYYRHLGNGKTINKTIWESWGVSWKVASVHNAAEEYWINCSQENITPPPSTLRVWIKNGNTLEGATPMLSKANLNIFFNTWWNWLSVGMVSNLANFVYTAFKAYTPDVILILDKKAEESAIRSDKISELVYHELSHASHFTKVGSSFWNRYVNAVINNAFKDFNDPYGDCKKNEGDLISLSESWAYYRGYFITWTKYNQYSQNWNQYYWSKLEDDIWYSCMSYQVYFDLWDGPYEGTTNGVVDEVNGGDYHNPNFTNRKMFDCLEPQIDAPYKYRDLFIQRYGSSQASAIRKLYQSYGL